MIKVTTAHKSQHIRGIKRLQTSNLKATISEKESIEQGFVTCEHSLDLLSQMNNPYPHIIALDGDKVVAYALVMLPYLRNAVDVLTPMFDLMDTLVWKKKPISDINYFVMGQICIDKDYRGQGIFYQLYDHMKNEMSAHFDLCVTEISSLNTRSLRAHVKQGFHTVHKFQSPDEHPWEIVGWDWKYDYI